MQTKMYSRSNCPLCVKATELLQQYGLDVEVIDVDADDELQAKYNQCVPVVFIDGKERFRGSINEVLLRRLIRAR